MQIAQALYIHIPFCRRKCPYCDFYSVAGREERTGGYAEAVRAELSHAAEQHPVGPLRTIYIGGGTPTVMAAGEIAGLLAAASELFAVAPDAEITCECNPGTVDAESLSELRAAGVNRLSIGVQSLDDPELRFLQRVHTAAEARQAVCDAREAGFPNVSLDLIYCLPGQTAQRWQTTLQEAVALGAEHISAYCLQIEEGTPLAERVKAGEVLPMADDEQAELYVLTGEALREAGCAQYEVSNYARPGAECAHNLTYWRNESYLGVGASAWSFVSGERRQNVADVDAYIAGWQAGRPAVAYRECCTGPQAANETLMMGLRLAEGIDVGEFRGRHGVDLEATRGPMIGRLRAEGLVAPDAGRLALTPTGMAIAAEITAALAFAEEE